MFKLFSDKHCHGQFSQSITAFSPHQGLEQATTRSELRGVMWKSCGVVALKLRGSESELGTLNPMTIFLPCCKAKDAAFHTTLSY